MLPNRIIVFVLLAIVGGGLAVNAQDRKLADPESSSAMSDPFPEIEGCVKLVQPASRTAGMVEQRVVYEPADPKMGAHDPRFTRCGNITVRSATGLGRLIRGNWERSKMAANFKIQGHDAWKPFQRCGVGAPLGYFEVYLSEDQYMMIMAYRGGGAILKFADNVDLRVISRYLQRLVSSVDQSGGRSSMVKFAR